MDYVSPAQGHSTKRQRDVSAEMALFLSTGLAEGLETANQVAFQMVEVVHVLEELPIVLGDVSIVDQGQYLMGDSVSAYNLDLLI